MPKFYSEKFRYAIIETIIQVNENEEETITTYGIRCNEGGSVIKEIPDISPNRLAVEELIQKMNTSGLAPIQLEEVVEDSLDDLI